MLLINKISNYEKDVCQVLAHVSYHIAPEIVDAVRKKNQRDKEFFTETLAAKIDVNTYLFDGSSCVFPGIRRYTNSEVKKYTYDFERKAIKDDNYFPRFIWTYLLSGKGPSGPNWKETGCSEFELAHIFPHKKSELELCRKLFGEVDDDLKPYANHTCACNTVLIPKGMAKPTDNSEAIKAAFYQRYFDLYDGASLIGMTGFKTNAVPDWYESLEWNDPILPEDWEVRLEKLLDYRKDRICEILQKHEDAD